MNEEKIQDAGLEHCKYWAFISYSHQDDRWGKWLHRSLESYRTPRRLVGRLGKDGPIPRRLFPVFRDTTEFSASGSLRQQMYDALHSAKNLVVICSPSAARSDYVNEEIRHFKFLGREDRILGLIVDGEPNVSPSDGEDDRECFPEAARFGVTAAGNLSDIPAEPIAADVRPGKDRHRDGLLRIIAGIFGISFDELKQRDRQRRTRRIVAATGAALFAAAAIGFGFGWQEMGKRRQIRAQRIESYTAIGQKEIDAANLPRAAAFLGEAYRLGGDGPRLRLLLAHAMEGIDVQEHLLSEGGSEIRAIVLSPDGRCTLTLAGVSTVELWDANGQTRLATLETGGMQIEDAAFTPDGAKILTCGLDREVCIWDAASGALLHRLKDHDSLLSKIAVDPSGRFFATLGLDGSAAIWRLGDQKARRLAADAAIRPPLLFDPAGTLLATRGYTGNRLLLWDVASGALRNDLPVENRADGMVFVRDGEALVTLSEGGRFEIRAPDSGSVLETFSTGSDALVFVGSVSGEERIALLDVSGKVHVWDLSSNWLSLALPTGIQNARVAAFDGHRLVLANPTSPVQLTVWDVRTGTHLSSAKTYGEDLLIAALAPDADLLTTGSNGGTIRTWRLGRRCRHFSLPGHKTMVNTVVFHPDGTRLLTAGSEATATIWDCEKGRPVDRIEGHRAAIFRAAYDRNGTRLVTLSIDGALGLWDGSSGERLRFIQDLGAEDIAVSGGDTFLVAVLFDSFCTLWQPETGFRKILDQHRVEIRAMAFNTEGSRFAIGNEDGTATVWDTGDGQPVHRLWGHSGAVTSIEFSDPSGRLLTASEDSTAVMWSLADGSPICTFNLHGAGIETARLSPDGEIVATGSRDNTVKLWRSADCRLLRSLDLHSASVTALAFSGDGEVIATGSDDRSVKIWERQSGALIRSLPLHAGPILDIAIHPGTDLLATAAKDPVARIWDLARENRSREALAAVLAERSSFRMGDEGLVAVRSGPDPAATVRGEASAGRPEDVRPSTSPAFDISSLPKALHSFLNALENGHTGDIRELIGERAASRIADLDGYDPEELRSIGTFFEGENHRDVLYRIDGTGALVSLEASQGRLDLRFEEEIGGWRIVDLRGRPNGESRDLDP